MRYHLILHLETADPDVVNEVVDALADLQDLSLQPDVQPEEVEAVLEKLSMDIPTLEMVLGFVTEDNKVVAYRAQDGQLEGPITLQDGGEVSGDGQQLLTDYAEGGGDMNDMD